MGEKGSLENLHARSESIIAPTPTLSFDEALDNVIVFLQQSMEKLEQLFGEDAKVQTIHIEINR